MRFMTYVSVDDRRPLESITKLCRESFRIEKALTELVLVARQQGAPGRRLAERSELWLVVSCREPIRRFAPCSKVRECF